MEYVIALFVGVLGSLIAAEFYAHSQVWAERIIRVASQRVPESEIDKRLEEWLAHLNDCPGNLGKLRHAIGCYIGAGSIHAPTPRPVTVRPQLNRLASRLIRGILLVEGRVTRAYYALMVVGVVSVFTGFASAALSIPQLTDWFNSFWRLLFN